MESLFIEEETYQRIKKEMNKKDDYFSIKKLYYIIKNDNMI